MIIWIIAAFALIAFIGLGVASRVGGGQSLPFMPKKAAMEDNETHEKWIKIYFHMHAGIENEDHNGTVSFSEVIEAYKKEGFHAIDITNGSSALEEWDFLLTNRQRVYGFGSDDGRVWNMVHAKGAGFEDVSAAVNAGNFYVTTGVLLTSFDVIGNTIHVRAKKTGEEGERFVYRFIGDGGKQRNQLEGTSAKFMVGSDSYIRVEAEAKGGEIMFLQPVFFKPPQDDNL